MADLVGQTLGNYRIESRLGSGGMGDVYRAVHVHLNRPAALKALHANQAEDATFQARFLREARAAAALSHPNIVEVFDFGEQDGASYLVMELVPDGSLRSLLRQRAKNEGWSLGLGIDLVRQAAEGLAYAHAHNMIHRDIKPDNLLIERLEPTRRGDHTDHYLLKISDFGLARLMEDSGELTQTGVVMGTPTYMSPEQCQGGALDGRSDLYSLGVVLYEVATGSPPFRVKTLSEAVFKHISAPPIPPRSVFPELPQALEDVIMRCLAKRPEDRFATGAELADALDGALGDTEMRTIVPTIASSGLATPSSQSSSPSSSPSSSIPAPTPPSTPTPTPAPVIAPVVAPEPAPALAQAPAQASAQSSEEANAQTIAASADSLAEVASPGSAGNSASGAQADGPRHAAPVPVLPAGAAVSASLAADDDSTVLATPSSLVMEPAAASVRAAASSAAPAAKPWPPAGAHPPAQPPAGLAGLRARAQAIPPGALGLVGVVILTLLIAGLVAVMSRPSGGQANVGAIRTATPHAVTPTASPTPVEPITYQAPLNSATRNWPISGRSFFANGGYEVSGAWISYAPANTFSNGVVSVQMRQLSGPANQFYGLLVRGANSNLYYFFGVNGSQQWTFSLVTDGNGKPLVAPTTDSHIATGPNASNTIALRANGGHFIFYVNGAQVGQSDDSAIPSGSLGLANTVGDLSVVYNNFTVTGAP